MPAASQRQRLIGQATSVLSLIGTFLLFISLSQCNSASFFFPLMLVIFRPHARLDPIQPTALQPAHCDYMSWNRFLSSNHVKGGNKITIETALFRTPVKAMFFLLLGHVRHRRSPNLLPGLSLWRRELSQK